MIAICYALALFCCGWLLWVFFLAVMMVKAVRDRGELPEGALYLAYSILAVGYLLDFIFNVLASVPFLEPPNELTFTARVSRHIGEDGWRGREARWFCKTLLDPFQVGGHCHK